MKPAIEAKRFKHDDEDDEDDDLDSEDKQQQQQQVLVGLTEDTPAARSEAALLIDEEKIAQIKANKNLDERQREFKDMLLERGVSIPY
jgi:anti-sigma28 factor (negative regulator of flagellin synthesis)